MKGDSNVNRLHECIKATPLLTNQRAIDRAIIGKGILIGTIFFIATILGASFSYREESSARRSLKNDNGRISNVEAKEE